MGSAVYNSDPTGKSTGQNTKLFLLKVLVSTLTAEVGPITHNLGFIPSWVRVTPLSQDDQGTPVLNTGVCEAMLDIAASGSAGLVWWDNSGVIDLTTDLAFAIKNVNVTYDAWFQIEIGRTHSRSK